MTRSWFAKNGQRGDSIIALVMAIGIGGVILAVIVTTMQQQEKSARVTAKDLAVTELRQQIRRTVACSETLAGKACAGATPNGFFALKRKDGSVVGTQQGTTWKLGDWSLRGSCSNKGLHVDYRPTKTPSDPWRSLFTDADGGLGCADVISAPPSATPTPSTAGRCQGPTVGQGDTKICARRVTCGTRAVAGVGYGCFAPCNADEIPMSCGYSASGAYTIGRTFAKVTTKNGSTGCECNIGAIDHCTNGTVATGCLSYCAGMCVRVVPGASP